MTDYDAIIIGAGHNGMICASYLAKAGKNVLVLDARVVPGGCASTREFAPGHHISDCAQWLSQFDQSIVKDLDLKAITSKNKAGLLLKELIVPALDEHESDVHSGVNEKR